MPVDFWRGKLRFSLAATRRWPNYSCMTDTTQKKPTTTEMKRAAFEQTTEFAKLAAEAEKKARDEKTARLRAMRLSKQQDH